VSQLILVHQIIVVHAEEIIRYVVLVIHAIMDSYVRTVDVMLAVMVTNNVVVETNVIQNF
jgi:hypothetical protein